MKILYIITQADGGGAQKYVLDLARHFKGEIAAGYESRVESRYIEAEKLFADAESAGLKTYRLTHLKRNIHPWHDFLAIWKIRGLVKKIKPDIVHLNSSKAGFLGSLAGIGTGAKVIFTAHGFRFLEPLSPTGRWFYKFLEKFASKFRDFIIAVSQTDANAAIAEKIINPEKICVIHNGILPIQFFPREEARQKLSNKISGHLNLSTNHITSQATTTGGYLEHSDKICKFGLYIIGTIANFYPTKGLDVLIDAVAMMSEQIKSKCLILIIGSGPEFENCKLKIENLNLTPYIKLLGQVEDAAKFLKAFDIFVLPSRKEGFPYTLLEAMQAGLPIIATDVGGNREALGAAGILIEPNNPTNLKTSIELLLMDNQKKSALAAKSLTQSKEFTLEKTLEQTEKIYKQVLVK